MSALVNPNVPPFALAVSQGLNSAQKHIDPCFLYDSIGAKLFSALTELPGSGRLRAEERLLNRHAADISQLTADGSLRLDLSQTEAASYPEAWLEAARRNVQSPVLLTLPGGLFGTLDPTRRHCFLKQLRPLLKPGDHFLFTCDLLDSTGKMMAAYDDPAGIVAAFNKNLLSRVNRELGGHFDLRRFQHKVKWNAPLHRIELHLTSVEEHDVYIGGLSQRIHFKCGESLHSASFYKFAELELEDLARSFGFASVKTWTGLESGLAALLWTSEA